MTTAYLLIFSGCTIPDTVTVTESYSYSPDPISDDEYDSKVSQRTEELIENSELSESEAETQAKREVDSKKWESEYTPVQQWKQTWTWGE